MASASAQGVESSSKLQIRTTSLPMELGDRQSSLLPGQVRTPKYPPPFPVSDWAATSSVWGDDESNDDICRNVSTGNNEDPPSIATPLTVYDRSRVWGTEGSIATSQSKMHPPLLDVLKQSSNQAAVATTTTTTTLSGTENMNIKMNKSTNDKGCRTGGMAKMSPECLADHHLASREEGALVVEMGMAAPVHAPPPTSPQQQQQQQQSGTYTASRIKYHHASTRPISSLEDFATSIIAAAGLPMSMVSLADYITEGQPQLPKEEQGGSLGNALGQSYTHIHPPPQGCSWNPPRHLDSRTPPAVNGQPHLTAWNAPLQVAHPNTHFVPVASALRPASPGTARKPKTQSEFLSDLLYFHANFFPPPPPPRVPLGTRRSRAELWYHYASKWDITHRLPPPPRTPLPEMEMERRERLQELTRTPYHGDRWLKICERWFDVAAQQFEYPAENTAAPIARGFVLRHVIAG